METKKTSLKSIFQHGRLVQQIAKATFALGLLVSAPSILTARSFSIVSAPQSVDVSITGPSSFCPGSSATLTANVTGCSGSTSYLWRRNGVFMPGATTASIAVTNPGDYTVAATCSGQTGTSAVFTLSRLTLKTNVENACPGSTGKVNLIVQNGTAPFTYLWSNGQISQDLMAVSSGNYSVAVTDAIGCVASTIATVNNTPVNIQAGENKAICNGSSTSLQASGADLYFWSPATGLSSTNVSNPTANPTSTTDYTVTGYVLSGDLVTNGDFNQGNQGILSSYAYVNSFANVAVGYTSGTGLYPEAKYTVVSNRNDSNVTKFHPGFAGVGRNRGELVGRNEDNYMAINGSTVLDQIVWSQTVEVLPGNDYSFSCWIASINASNPSQLRFLINGVELGPQIVAPSVMNTWIQFYTVWNSASATTATISIINDNTIAGGNDFGLDDISFSTTCFNSSMVTVSVNDGIVGNIITAPNSTQNCLSVDAAEIAGSIPTGGTGSYTYQWQISTDNSTWDNIDGATAQSYNPGVVYTSARYRRVATSGACTLESNIVTITIASTYTISNNTITAPTPSSFCVARNPGNISGSTPSASGSGSFTYIWLTSNDGNEFVEIPGANLSSYDPGELSQTTYFRRIAKKGTCTSAQSNMVTITINSQPSISIVSGGTVCGSGSSTLEVASAGSTITWYASEASSTVLYTGSAYTTPSVSTTTDFYAQAMLNGCLSAKIPVTLNVNSNPSVVSVENGSVCDMGDVTVSAVASEGTISWYSESVEGNLVGTSNEFTFTNISNAASVYAQATNNGCVSSRVEANASIKNATSFEETITNCDSYSWNGETYTESGDYTATLENAAGCDSTVKLHLTINYSSTSEKTASACGSYTWNEVEYTTSGDKTYSTLNAVGCDSIATLHLTINQPSTYSFSASISQGQSYDFFGQSLTVGGPYQKVIPNAAGCDSTITLNLTVVPVVNPSDCGTNKIANGDFEAGNTGFTSAYTYTADLAGNSELVPENRYAVGANANNYHPQLIGIGNNGTGNFLIVNGNTTTVKELWAQNVDVTAGREYTFKMYTQNLYTLNAPKFSFKITPNDGVSGSVEFGTSNPLAGRNGWIEVSATYTANFTGSAKLSIIDTDLTKIGNDFGIDDISFIETCPVGCSPVEVISYNPGPQSDFLTPISTDRIDFTEALGTPENSDVATSVADYNFVTLGFAGEIVLKFAYPIKNGEGDDIYVVETSFGSPSCARYPEKIRAYASQDNCNWVFLGEGCQDTYFDLQGLRWAQYVKIVDMTNPASFTGLNDGYDLDGVVCLHGEELNPTPTDLVGGSAQTVVNYAPGLCKNGNAVPAARRIPESALGTAQNNNTINFVALGFGGSLVVKFDYVIFNNPAATDIKVVETSYGNPSCAAYPERAIVEGSLFENGPWTLFGELCQDGEVEIGNTPVQYIRVTDRSAASSFGGSADAYDVDAIVVINPTCGTLAARNAAQQIVDVINVANEEVSSNLFPNPASDMTVLSIEGTTANETWTVSISDISGRVISTTTFVSNEGISEHRISVSELSFGIYQIVATNGSNKIVQKLVH